MLAAAAYAEPVPLPQLSAQPDSAGIATALGASLAALRAELELPERFTDAVLHEAASAVASMRVDDPELDDLRSIPLFTIDPAGSTDLDQALHLERTATGAVLHYAIADVPAFVTAGGAVDAEARRRGQTMYAPDARIPLHPESLSEDAASLLPGLDRRAYVWRFELDALAAVTAVTLRRASVQSRHQWTYDDAQAAIDDGTAPPELAALAWFGPLRAELERGRGGASLDLPHARIVADDGPMRIERESSLPIERWNAQVSLMTGMAAAELMLAGRVGILRTMPPAADEDVAAFRSQTVALGVPWAAEVAYGDYLRDLDRADPRALAVLDAATGLFRGAGYVAFDGEVPDQTVQAAIAAPYAHTTAPLRRLVDRWSLVICEAIANDRPVPGWARESLASVPGLMAASDSIASRFSAGALDRVEAAVLTGREGEVFEGVVLRERGEGATATIRVQLVEPPVTATASGAHDGVGTRVRVRLMRAEVATGELVFTTEDGR